MIRLTLLALTLTTIAAAAPAYAKPATSNDVINACTRQSDCHYDITNSGEVIGSTDQGTFYCSSGGESSTCMSIPYEHPKKHKD